MLVFNNNATYTEYWYYWKEILLKPRMMYVSVNLFNVGQIYHDVNKPLSKPLS